MTWILALANYLQSQSLGTTGTDLFIGTLPDVSGVGIVLTQYSGQVVETQASGIAIHQPSLQVKVHGASEDYVTPLTRITAIQDAFSTITNETLSGIEFLRVKPITSIIALGQDENLVYDFTCNFEVSYA
jgi:hypothetical protein|tara:strand:+ start:3433 stop:3822 length:390 start_codon:yes stop_codon:yes gene_type:complete